MDGDVVGVCEVLLLSAPCEPLASQAVTAKGCVNFRRGPSNHAQSSAIVLSGVQYDAIILLYILFSVPSVNCSTGGWRRHYYQLLVTAVLYCPQYDTTS